MPSNTLLVSIEKPVSASMNATMTAPGPTTLHMLIKPLLKLSLILAASSSNVVSFSASVTNPYRFSLLFLL